MHNIGVIVHIAAGNTMTTDRLLYYKGPTHRLGSIDNGTTVTGWNSDLAGVLCE
jgi:elongation factor G